MDLNERECLLRRMVHLWPTPTINGNYNRKGLSKTSGDGLATRVRSSMNESCANGTDSRGNGPTMWPTPSANKTTLSGELINADGTPWDGISKPHSATTGRPVSTHLTDAVKMWPTPTVDDSSNVNPKANRRPGLVSKVNDAERDQSPAPIGGSLNPQWVEWLMGYPAGWTDLGDSATPSSRKSRKS